MKRFTIIVSLALTLAIAALAGLVTPDKAAGGVSVSRFPVNFSLFNPCTNESVQVSGTALTVVDPTPDNHGLTFHSVDVALKGVGETTGSRYVEHFAVTISLQGTEGEGDNGAFAETNAVHSRLVTPGPANDLAFAIVFHVTINANGETVGFHNRVTIGACV
jgi:hypothetical protein